MANFSIASGTNRSLASDVFGVRVFFYFSSFPHGYSGFITLRWSVATESRTAAGCVVLANWEAEKLRVRWLAVSPSVLTNKSAELDSDGSSRLANARLLARLAYPR